VNAVSGEEGSEPNGMADHEHETAESEKPGAGLAEADTAGHSLDALLKAASRKERRTARHAARSEGLPLERALWRVLERAKTKAAIASFDEFMRRRLAQRDDEDRRRRATATTWRGWFDGATEPVNPGPSGIGALLTGPEGQRIEISRAIGIGTNNEAEYRALIALLETAVEHGVGSLIVHGDSQLVINQVAGDWSVGAPRLVPWYRQARRLVKRIGQVDWRWIPREQNRAADRLSHAALGSCADQSGRRGKKGMWGNQTAIGRRLGCSAVAVGKQLDALGWRRDGRATDVAIREGLARVYPTAYGMRTDWHIQHVVERLASRTVAASPQAATPRTGETGA